MHIVETFPIHYQQFFLSASLDGKLRLWNIPDKKVMKWNEVEGSTRLITAANFIQGIHSIVISPVPKFVPEFDPGQVMCEVLDMYYKDSKPEVP